MAPPGDAEVDEPVAIEAPIVTPAPREDSTISSATSEPFGDTVSIKDADELFNQLYNQAIVIPPTIERVVQVTIDKHMALKLLTRNIFWKPGGQEVASFVRSNRPIVWGQVDVYAEDMVPSDGSAGRWKKTDQAFAFSTDGKLLNGQTRLLGLIEAAVRDPNFSAPFYIWFDMDPDTFNAYDLGRPRGIGDLLGLDHEVNRNLLGASARLVMLYKRNVDRGSVNWKQRISTIEQHQWARANPAIKEAVRVGGVTAKGAGIRASSLAALHFLAAEALPDRADGLTVDPLDLFMTGLLNGRHLDGGDPRLALRDWGHRKHKEDDNRNTVHLAIAVKAWNAFLGGVEMTFPRFQGRAEGNRPAEDFPEPLKKWNGGYKEAFANRYGVKADEAVEALHLAA